MKIAIKFKKMDKQIIRECLSVEYFTDSIYKEHKLRINLPDNKTATYPMWTIERFGII